MKEEKKDKKKEHNEMSKAVEEINEVSKEEEYLNNWKRCQADMENFRKDTERRMAGFKEYAALDIIYQILPVLDNFESSLEHIPEDQKDSGWVQGILYIKKQLEDVLKNNGVDEIVVKVGDNFNPEIHEAVQQEECGKKDEAKNVIKKIIQRGYKIDKRVIRAARVIVE